MLGAQAEHSPISAHIPTALLYSKQQFEQLAVVAAYAHTLTKSLSMGKDADRLASRPRLGRTGRVPRNPSVRGSSRVGGMERMRYAEAGEDLSIAGKARRGERGRSGGEG